MKVLYLGPDGALVAGLTGVLDLVHCQNTWQGLPWVLPDSVTVYTGFHRSYFCHEL
jgi:hypothetical protein